VWCTVGNASAPGLGVLIKVSSWCVFSGIVTDSAPGRTATATVQTIRFPSALAAITTEFPRADGFIAAYVRLCDKFREAKRIGVIGRRLTLPLYSELAAATRLDYQHVRVEICHL
jgi:hypothetical protein